MKNIKNCCIQSQIDFLGRVLTIKEVVIIMANLIPYFQGWLSANWAIFPLSLLIWLLYRKREPIYWLDKPIFNTIRKCSFDKTEEPKEEYISLLDASSLFYEEAKKLQPSLNFQWDYEFANPKAVADRRRLGIKNDLSITMNTIIAGLLGDSRKSKIRLFGIEAYPSNHKVQIKPEQIEFSNFNPDFSTLKNRDGIEIFRDFYFLSKDFEEWMKNELALISSLKATSS